MLLNNKITEQNDQITSMLNIENHILEENILEMNWQNFKTIIVQFIAKNSEILSKYHSDQSESEKEEINKRKDAIIQEHQLKNIELEKELQITRMKLQHSEAQFK